MKRRPRPYRNLIGVYVREERDSNLVFVEHVYLFARGNGLSDIYFQRSYGWTSKVKMTDIIACQEDIWAPSLQATWIDKSHDDTQAYLQLVDSPEPRSIYGGAWRKVLER